MELSLIIFPCMNEEFWLCKSGMSAQLQIHFRRGQGYLIISKMFSILSDDSLPSFTSSVEEALPTLNPAVEDALLEFLRVEVSEYIISLHGTKCELCPFRVVSGFKYLKKHLKTHIVENMYLSDRRSPQRAVVRAYFDYIRATTPISLKPSACFGLLRYSAAIITEWNSMCPSTTLALLQKRNRPVLVRVLTHTGPQY